MDFGLKLKKIRRENNLSQLDMAEILFTIQGNYSQYESNQRTPSFDLLKRLIGKFNLDASWLLSTNDCQTVLKNDTPVDVAEKLLNIEKKIDEILSKI